MTAYFKGAYAALNVLGLMKEAASVTSTLLPKLADPDGVGLHLAKLKQLSSGAARNTLPSNIETATPALTYLSWLGNTPSKTLESDFTRKILQRQASPDILNMAKKWDAHSPTIPAPSYFKEVV